jgi:hypothetical protein
MPASNAAFYYNGGFFNQTFFLQLAYLQGNVTTAGVKTFNVTMTGLLPQALEAGVQVFSNMFGQVNPYNSATVGTIISGAGGSMSLSLATPPDLAFSWAGCGPSAGAGTGYTKSTAGAPTSAGFASLISIYKEGSLNPGSGGETVPYTWSNSSTEFVGVASEFFAGGSGLSLAIIQR